MEPKTREAIDIIIRCRTEKGFVASADRYNEEYWTRDFYYSLNALLSMGFIEESERHLMNIWSRQTRSGALPRLIRYNYIRWGVIKLFNMIKSHRFLSTLRVGKDVETRLHQWSVDSTLAAIIATYIVAERSKNDNLLHLLKPKMNLAMSYLKKRIKNGFIRGGDWRDLIPSLGDKFLLSNNVLLHRVYRLSGNLRAADRLRKQIGSKFWNGNYYIDFLGGQEFDTLGTSLMVLEELVPKSRYPKLIRKLISASTKYGIKNSLEINRVTWSKAEGYELTNQRYSIWPFVAYFAVSALKKMGAEKDADVELKKLRALRGFYEWYNPDTGAPMGSKDQLWSAAGYYEFEKTRVKRL